MNVSSPLRLYVAAGATSNLFSTAVLPLLRHHGQNYEIYATVRGVTASGICRVGLQAAGIVAIDVLQQNGVQFISPAEVENYKFDRVLWFSTHDDPEWLTKLARTAPTLAISSGAIMDYHLGKMTEDQLNAYQKSKLILGRIPGIYTLIPGFYIEDVVSPDWASKGLHGDTTTKLFSRDPVPPDFDWGKTYSVTPKSILARAVLNWVADPTCIKRNQPVIACSDRVYSRADLRRLVIDEAPVGGKNFATRASEEPIYDRFEHIVRITDDDVRKACIVADAIQQFAFK